MEFISERVSLERSPDGVSVVISARSPRAKEAMLLAWFLAWLACGVYIAVELSRMPAGSMHSFFIAFMAFWTWFAIRIGRAVLWRLKGFELLRLKEGRFTIKDSIFGYGRANDYFVENVQRLGLLKIDELSWKWQLNDSFWVMGGERLGFEHIGKKVVFGKGITHEEAERIAQVLDRSFKQVRKKTQ
jgi:hypothetical protein